MAGNDTEGLLYGTTETTEEYYLTWKESWLDNEGRLDKSILQLCEKNDFWKLFTISLFLIAVSKRPVDTINTLA